jgi:hypothetical protein
MSNIIMKNLYISRVRYITFPEWLKEWWNKKPFPLPQPVPQQILNL